MTEVTMGDLADRARDEANYELVCEYCGEEECKLPVEEHIIIPDARQEVDW